MAAKKWSSSADLRRSAEEIFSALQEKEITPETAKVLGAQIRTAVSTIGHELAMTKLTGQKPVNGKLKAIKLSD